MDLSMDLSRAAGSPGGGVSRRDLPLLPRTLTGEVGPLQGCRWATSPSPSGKATARRGDDSQAGPTASPNGAASPPTQQPASGAAGDRTEFGSPSTIPRAPLV